MLVHFYFLQKKKKTKPKTKTKGLVYRRDQTHVTGNSSSQPKASAAGVSKDIHVVVSLSANSSFDTPGILYSSKSWSSFLYPRLLWAASSVSCL